MRDERSIFGWSISVFGENYSDDKKQKGKMLIIDTGKKLFEGCYRCNFYHKSEFGLLKRNRFFLKFNMGMREKSRSENVKKQFGGPTFLLKTSRKKELIKLQSSHQKAQN